MRRAGVSNLQYNRAALSKLYFVRGGGGGGGVGRGLTLDKSPPSISLAMASVFAVASLLSGGRIPCPTFLRLVTYTTKSVLFSVRVCI